MVYVNSRDQAAQLARTLRKRVPELAHAIAFYHAGLAREDRTRIEEAFRAGALECIVSTSRLVRREPARHPARGALPHAVLRYRVQPDERPRRP